jgi:hypothetical protein
MDLIKRIRLAEQQAGEIVEKAAAEAAAREAKFHQEKDRLREEASRERDRAVETATAAGQEKAIEQVKRLEAAAEKERRQLRKTAETKKNKAVSRILDYMKD